MIWLRLAPYIGLLLMGCVIVILWKDGQHLAAQKARIEADLQTSVAANKSLEKVNADLNENIKRNNAITVQTLNAQNGVDEAIEELTQKIEDLERNDDATRDYLAQPIPDGLRMQLSR